MKQLEDEFLAYHHSARHFFRIYAVDISFARDLAKSLQKILVF